MDTIINKTQSFLFEDHLDFDADDSNAAKEYALILVAKGISPKKINAKLAHSILLKAWNPSKDEIEFHHSPFWIRIYGLPPNQMTKSNAERIGARIGELKDIDFTADGNIACCKFLRIQVEIDIRQPIHAGFHGNQRSIFHLMDQSQFWTDKGVLAEAFEGPWTYIGKFNAVANQIEKKGGRPVANPSSGGICEFINQQHMIDLGFSGNPFTWSNNRPLSANIKERLDKAYANTAWCTLFPDASVTHLPRKASDHLPIVLKTHKPIYCGLKAFKFEAA
ncbi:hypothetical protein RJ639_024133 [Escallonia herrerae]|uniref:Uncharacterized protein n=1 Tax=Escallonia herrerae TaxID=1293975 RepID=A0AA89AEB3_9ASTE|nr:hypothetical protein RJ639_024133 [Escallonia herrerae]